MKWREQHEAFKRFLIEGGISRREEFKAALPFGCTVPDHKISKWLNHTLAVPKDFSGQRRYINRFKIGADPEFIFTELGRPQVRFDARSFGDMHQGLAYGMDNNGRLVEIRPYPSRSALNVVASILSTLRWIAVRHPQAVSYDWQSGIFLCNDGLGGHVHFGRKRPNRTREIKALDAVSDELINVRIYNGADIQRRRQGDAHMQRYGMPGDFRLQQHGYEYRTFPSWMDSPELAFLVLTLSKLTVHNPTLLSTAPLESWTRHHQRLYNFLSYYKDIDDDARLALQLLARKTPVHVGGDFKARWGIAKVINTPKVAFLPSSIEPSAEEIKDVFDCLANQVPLAMKIPTPSWEPTNPPTGYEMALLHTNTHGAKGLGELLYDVVQSEQLRYSFSAIKAMGKKDSFFGIPNKLVQRLPAKWQEMCPHVTAYSDDGVIYVTDLARTYKNFHESRRILLETVLPFWRITDVQADSYVQWKTHTRVKTERFWDKVVFASDELPFFGRR
jgi:hypothetical protein